MSTRSMIGYIDKNGDVRASFCHHDGYIDGVGTTLHNCYRDPAQIKRMVNYGARSNLYDIPEFGLYGSPYLLPLMDFDTFGEGEPPHTISINDFMEITKHTKDADGEVLTPYWYIDYTYVFTEGWQVAHWSRTSVTDFNTPIPDDSLGESLDQVITTLVNQEVITNGYFSAQSAIKTANHFREKVGHPILTIEETMGWELPKSYPEVIPEHA